MVISRQCFSLDSFLICLFFTNSPYNTHWLRSCWGESVISQIGHNNIVCSGNIMGSAKALKTVFEDMIRLAQSVPECVGSPGIDQVCLLSTSLILFDLI